MHQEHESILRVILIDDELPALQVLEFLLGDFDGLEIAGKYTDPLQALAELPEQQPDAIFLDIHMPQMKGIDVASRILEVCPSADIVFVTAYEEYALEAFAVHAVDYVLKPVDPDRLARTVLWLRQRQQEKVDRTTWHLQTTKQQADGHNQETVQPSQPRLEIRTLGQFRVGFPDQKPVHWRSAKTKELFAYLLHKQGREVRKEELIDVLWPDVDPEKAYDWLYNGIYYIRKALEAAGIGSEQIRIEARQAGTYQLAMGDVEWDQPHFNLLSQQPDQLEDLLQLNQIYQGDYFEGEDYPWALVEREFLVSRFQSCLLQLADRYREKGRWSLAEDALQLAFHRDPLEERITEILLSLYRELGNESRLRRQYEQYAKVLMEEMGIKPSYRIVRFLE